MGMLMAFSQFLVGRAINLLFAREYSNDLADGCLRGG
jgi:hypothetical protein